MKVKIDTREVFHVITIDEKELTANMAAVLNDLIQEKQEVDLKSLIISFKEVERIDPSFKRELENIHHLQVERQKSFVVCELSEELKKQLSIDNDFVQFQVTPTASEAWDIVQMEEIERELGLDL